MAGKTYILMIACLFAQLTVFAHSPSSIEAGYDNKKLQLHVKVYHSTTNPSGHYISKIVIVKNGAIVAEEKFVKQDNVDFEEHVFGITGIKPGDKIKVEAFCNISGFKSAMVEIK